MDKEEKILLDDVFNFDTNEGEEETEQNSNNNNKYTNNSVDDIIKKNIEERNKSNDNDKEYISKFNKDNLLSAKDIKSEKLIEDPDLVESLLENQNKINEDEKNKDKIIDEQNKNKIDICRNKKQIKFPDKFEKNPTPFDFIDFMERDYNKYVLEKDRDKYFYLEKYQKEGKFNEVKCWKFVQKNSITNHVVKDVNNYNPKQAKETKITCIVANKELIYIGDNNGVIKIFSLKTEIEIGPLNYKPEELKNISKINEENASVTSMDIFPSKNLLACGYYNGIVEVWDLENKKCRKKLLPSTTLHKSQILAVKFLNGTPKMTELITSDCSGLVNIIELTEGLFSFGKNAQMNANINVLIDYSQPIFVVEMLKFTEEEKKMPFLKKNIEIIGFACYDYVFIYQINPELVELFKFTRPDYFKDYYIANISFGNGYIPRTKNIIDINRDQNQKLNEKASEYCIDTKNINRLVAVSWDTFINIYAIKFDLENGVENIAIVGNYINSCQIKRMFFVGESILFIYDGKGIFKLLNTGMMTPGEILLDEKEKTPLYDKDKEKRALVQEPKRIINKVLKQNYIPESTKKSENDIITKETYYNSIYSNDNNIYILGEHELEYGEIYSYEECIDKLKDDLEWINCLIFGLKLYQGEYISFSGVPIDEKKRREKIGEKMRQIIKEYIEARFKLDKTQINETKYNEILTSCIYLSIEFCFAIESINFLFNEIAPIYSKKNLDKFFYESLEPYIINGNIGNQIIDEKILVKIVLLFIDKKKYQALGQIIKNLYLSVSDSEIVGNRTTKYDIIFTGLITYCSGEKNKDFMFPAREIYSYLQSAKYIPRELYWKVQNENDGKKYYYFDYENVVNNTDIDELILSYQYLGSLLLWYIYLCLEGYKFPSNKPIENKKHEALIQQLFLWLINDEVLQRLIEFDSYSLFFIFKKFFNNNIKIIEKIEYSDLFKLIKIGDKELQEAKIQKYIEIILRKALRSDKGENNIYVNDDLYDFICTIATRVEVISESDIKNNFLLDALKHIIKYKENYKTMIEREQEIIEQKGENYIKYTETKDKYDRYCMHLNRYKDTKYISNLSNIIMAAIENNYTYFSETDLNELVLEIDKTEFIKVKIYLNRKLGRFEKCLDVYLDEFKGQEKIILLYHFINEELSKLKNDTKKYNKFKNDILSRITKIASLSISNLIELTENWFDRNYGQILFQIENKSNKLHYLEEILCKYKEDEIGQNEYVIKEYIKILKLHIDLLCELKYFDKILPNLKKRNFYPVEYCLKKCTEYKIYDACIYLERKNGNINNAVKLINLLTKEEFSNFKKFWNENYEKILKLKEERKLNNKSANEEKNKSNYINEDEEEEEEYSYSNENDNISEFEDDENQEIKNKKSEDDILVQNRKIKKKQNKILRIGIEICETASEILSKKEAQENWSSLLKLYYELVNEIRSNIKNSELNFKVGEKILKKLDDNICEIIEKMNSYFDLKSVLDLLSEIQGKSFGISEFKTHLRKLLLNGMSFNYILQSAESIIKGYTFESKEIYKEMLKHGRLFNYEKCDYCNKIFKENDKNSMIFFNCGHKSHFDCCIFVNDIISCRLCKNLELINEDIMFKPEEDIRLPEERNRINRINSFYKSSSSSGIKSKVDKEKMKKLKLLNEVNKRYFETSNIFDIK